MIAPNRFLIEGLCLAALVAVPSAARAQRASENAVADADDAFGNNVGMEQTGIYSENDTRGFSPVKAGNVRIEGVYYDPVANLSSRVRAGTSIRVGFASQNFPFHAPTGIADYHFRPFPQKLGASVGRTFTPFGGSLNEVDLRIPVVAGHVGITGGFATADLRSSDESFNRSWGAAFRPFFRFGSAELVPFVTTVKYRDMYPHPLVVISGTTVPELPRKRVRYYPLWAKGMQRHWHYGGTLKVGLGERLSLRAGLFRGEAPRQANFSHLFILSDAGDDVYRVLSDPLQDIHSTSGEALFSLKLGDGRMQHRVFAGYRARNRYTETGGAIPATHVTPLGDPAHGDILAQFANAARVMAPLGTPVADVNHGRVRQSSLMLGYSGKLPGVVTINLGLQKARYRADSYVAVSRTILEPERDSPWLYNATAAFDLSRRFSVYIGSEKGLEDSGIAPESAANRNEQLPAARTTQYEGGLRWKFDGGQFVASAFQITKPFFALNAGRSYVRQGSVRHRGVEASLSGQFGKRLHLVAGAVLLQPRVLGDAAANGRRPPGTPSLYAKADATYRTDIFGGLTPTASVTYTGSRAVGPIPKAGARQLMLPGYATVDLGLRQQFKLGKLPASFRAVVQNVFDKGAWKVAGPGTLYMDERRRFTLALAADF